MIFVVDDQTPEDVAMMAALYSRSAQSVTKHLEKVKKTGSGKFMQSYYVEYGHESIADCGSTTIFIENVSILAAKAIQDWPLYSGQETSTRYIDMSKQNFTNPLNLDIQQKWMDFYHSSQEPLMIHLKTLYPRLNNESETIYNKAIAARCFDILRGFLPAGINTQLAWHTNLRQAANKLTTLRHHPDPIIKELSYKIHKELIKKYPSSFSHKQYPEEEKYLATIPHYFKSSNNLSLSTTINNDDLLDDIIQKRPPKAKLPRYLDDLGQIKFNFMIDFGSFRDIQRHRSGICRMPLLTIENGFHSWYLDNLSEPLRKKALELIEEQIKEIKKIDDIILAQYYIPLGFIVGCQMTFTLPGAVYTLELRSGNTVHSTLRQLSHDLTKQLREKLPNIVLHCDMGPDEWNLKRGKQDIVKID